ncbi:hypothetical protein M9H77_36477 [Catharanthus roseus]|uniref:Uncharacterized protein n=1 Tax=Catharanthus roseus TaxID=4058 RepID=A0ACB9ZU38_CATRO|nr:hypothetical protein M9H77_36477 [Catharanthus roseus]
MRVSSAAGKSKRIKTHQRSFYLLRPEFKRTCNATVGLYGQSADAQNEAIETKFQHLVVNTSQTPYERSITNNRTPISQVKTGYRLLGHLPGLPWGQPQFRAPPDSPLDRPTVEHDAMST